MIRRDVHADCQCMPSGSAGWADLRLGLSARSGDSALFALRSGDSALLALRSGDRALLMPWSRGAARVLRWGLSARPGASGLLSACLQNTAPALVKLLCP